MAVRFTRASSQYWSRTSGVVLDYNADYTLMGWFYLVSDVNGYHSFFGAYASSDSRSDVLQTANDGTTFNLYCGNADAGVSLDANGGQLPIGQWVHLALVRERRALSNSIVRACLNGYTNVAGEHNPTSRAVAARMYVASWFGASDYGNCRVAQLRAWQGVALNEAQIRAEMENPAPVLTRNLWGWWPAWDRGAGARAMDWSGNGYNWTETATPTDEDDPPTNPSLFLLPAMSDGAAAPTEISGSDSGTLSESAALAADVPGSEAGTLSEAVAIATALSGSDSGSLTEVSELSTADQLAGSESGTFAEAASLVAAIAANDSGNETETGALAVDLAGFEAGTFAEASSLDTVTQIAGSEAGTFSESASLAGVLAASDSGSFSESSSVGSFSSNHQISVGDGYTDVTPRQLVRTSDNRLWIAAWKFDDYPQGTVTGLGQTLRMYKADQVGTPSAFTRMDSSHEPVDVNAWSLAVGANDVIHLVWTKRASWIDGHSYLEDGTDNYIYYCQFDTIAGTWGTPETIETAAAIVEMGQGDELCAIAVDADGVPHIVYLKSDGTRRRVNYRNRAGGTWSSATVVDDQSFSGDQRCWHPGICFDQSGHIVVTWLRGTHTTSDDGRIFIRVYDGSWGTTHDVVGANVFVGIDNGTPLYIDAANRFHLCYITTSATKYAQYRFSDDVGATWTANHPGSGTFAGDNPTPAPGAPGKVRIYVHGLSGDNYPITYWEGSGGSASWGSSAIYSSGATPNDCSVNVRWARYFWWHPNTLDVAYWQSNYPTNALYVGMDIEATDLYGTDNGTFSETSALATAAAGSDSGAETETSALAAALAASDSGTFSETGAISSAPAGTDSGTLAESSSLAAAVPGAESATFNEASALAAALAASDSGTLTDAAELSTANQIAGTDSGIFEETGSLAVAAPGSESGSLNEATAIAVTLSANDSGTFSESSDLLSGMLLSGMDSGTFSEVSSLTVVVSATEVCTFSEAAANAAALAGSDSGIFGEASDLAIGMPIEGSDSGMFVESSSLTVAIAANDVFTFGEVSGLAAALSASDSAIFEASGILSGESIARDVLRLALYIERSWALDLTIKRSHSVDLEL